MAEKRESFSARVESATTGGVAGRLWLSPTLRFRLLLPADAQPLPAELRCRPEGRTSRPVGQRESPDGFPAAEIVFQRGRPVRPPPHGRTALWEALAAVCRSDCSVSHGPSQRLTWGDYRVHWAHLERARVHGGPVPFHEEIRARSRHTQPRLGDRRGRSPGHQGCPTAGRRTAGAAGGVFFAPTQYAGAFLLLPDVLNWLATAENCFRDEYGSLCRGLLSSVFALGIGMPRIFPLDPMGGWGFAVL